MKTDHVSRNTKHGTQYLYEVEYNDRFDSGCPTFDVRMWAYDLASAINKFQETQEEGESWCIVRLARVQTDTPRHRWVWCK